ncbi:MAG TPA: squalene--hopene cyclase, partial [Dissulfurispiraceae bacterium]|nr:squalene--hopene cyclase [Dissulfurispiraceae bacterium]
SNVTITAEYLMLLHFIDLKDPERDRKIARYILNKQRPDGSWAIHWGGKGDLSTTVEAYFALKLAGLSADDLSLRKARAFILQNGGAENVRVFTRIFLALFGQCDWKAIPSIPVETNLLPAWFPVNIYEFSSWARSTFVPLSIILDTKPEKQLPGSLGIRELYKDPHTIPPVTSQKFSFISIKYLLVLIDSLLKTIEKLQIRPLRKIALERTEKWLLEHQEPTGDWGGIQPAMVNSILALAARGYDVSHDPVRRGLSALERFTIESEEELCLQSCISPIWDTALTALALDCSGIGREHHSVVKACTWLLSKQIFCKGDWSIKRPNLEPGGWAFEFDNNWYPDVDDTAVVLMLLLRYRDKDFIDSGNLQKGINWMLGMQGKDGGWGAFDVDNDTRILNELPFSDLEATIDPSTPDLTGRVLEVLGQNGYDLSNRAVRRGIKFLKRTQEDDGSWWGRWGVNHIYGTWSVLCGLASVGVDMSRPYAQRAIQWLKKCQNPDGGWGECCESYETAAKRGCGLSTPSQTAWAILGLIAAGEGKSAEVHRGVRYLLNGQLPDGTWKEDEFTGTGFPKYFMIRYHNYKDCFPLLALGRFMSELPARDAGK